MGKYRTKWYDSKAWLKLYYIDQDKSIEEIAEVAQVSNETIRNLLTKHGLKKRIS